MAVCEYYAQRFKDIAGLTVPLFNMVENGFSFNSSYHLFPLILENASTEQRDLIIKNMADNDVSANVHFLPVPATSFYKSLGYSMKDYPVAQRNFEREISLPVFTAMTESQMKRVADVFLQSFYALTKG
jgi:dTDP-4-amino-4,6-dideoxygalactose transaminase